MAAFLADCSLLALVLPLSLFCYALVSPRPSRLYWRAMLIYTELLVVAQVGLSMVCGLREGGTGRKSLRRCVAQEGMCGWVQKVRNRKAFT